jgi:pentatricopeptide repeat protein
MPHRDTVSWNTMLTAYTHSGDIKTAISLFDAMPNPDVVSWNALISSYCQRGMYRESVALFLEMARSGVASDRTTFAVLLKSCGALDDLALGVQIHALAVKTGLGIDVRTGSALVDMYGKCSSLEDGLFFFYAMPDRNWVSWGAAIAECVPNDQ